MNIVSFRFTYVISSLILDLIVNIIGMAYVITLVLSFQRAPQELSLKKRSHLGATSCLHHEATWHQDSSMLQEQIGPSFVELHFDWKENESMKIV